MLGCDSYSRMLCARTAAWQYEQLHCIDPCLHDLQLLISKAQSTLAATETVILDIQYNASPLLLTFNECCYNTTMLLQHHNIDSQTCRKYCIITSSNALGLTPEYICDPNVYSVASIHSEQIVKRSSSQ